MCPFRRREYPRELGRLAAHIVAAPRRDPGDSRNNTKLCLGELSNLFLRSIVGYPTYWPMADSLRYTAIADQMLRLAATAISEFERNGYIELARAWRRLAAEAADLERSAGDGRGDPMPPPAPEPSAEG